MLPVTGFDGVQLGKLYKQTHGRVTAKQNMILADMLAPYLSVVPSHARCKGFHKTTKLLCEIAFRKGTQIYQIWS